MRAVFSQDRPRRGKTYKIAKGARKHLKSLCQSL